VVEIRENIDICYTLWFFESFLSYRHFSYLLVSLSSKDVQTAPSNWSYSCMSLWSMQQTYLSEILSLFVHLYVVFYIAIDFMFPLDWNLKHSSLNKKHTVAVLPLLEHYLVSYRSPQIHIVDNWVLLIFFEIFEQKWWHKVKFNHHLCLLLLNPWFSYIDSFSCIAGHHIACLCTNPISFNKPFVSQFLITQSFKFIIIDLVFLLHDIVDIDYSFRSN